MRRALKLLLFVVAGLQFLLPGCRKEDHEKLRKEALVKAVINEINSDSLKSDVIWLQNFGTRFCLADNHREVAEEIRKKFISLGYENAELDSFPVYKIYRNVNYEQWQYNVIATLDGSLYPDSLSVIGSHYDNIISSGDPFTVAPGANDNASGVAGVLEIARAFKKYDFIPETTIKFIAFAAEEIGLLGSKNFASNPDGFTSRIRFMINFDMISYETEVNPALWYVNIIDYDNSHFLRSEAEKMCNNYTNLLSRNDNTYYRQSDSYPFYTNGYRALFFISDEIDPYYHTLNDVAGNFNFGYCREVVKVGCALMAEKN